MGEHEDQANKRPPWWKRLWGWTGFGEKKLWDWLHLLSALAIPAVLAVAGFWFTAQQQEQQQKIESQRAAHERELAEQHAQDVLLQDYLSHMTNLLLEEDLRSSDENSEVRTLAQVRTLSVLSRLHPDRKRAVIQFLIGTALVEGKEGSKKPLIGLHGADLRDLNMPGVSFEYALLVGVELSGANLRNSYLGDALMQFADLSSANLSGANLSSADLSNANLAFTRLTGADLSGVNLRGANGVTEERLEAQTKTLEGANMPDGSKHP